MTTSPTEDDLMTVIVAARLKAEQWSDFYRQRTKQSNRENVHKFARAAYRFEQDCK